MTLVEELVAAVGTDQGAGAADRLCVACVDVLGIDAAAVSLVIDGVNSATVGSSDASAITYDEVQFTMGEGPCLDSVGRRRAVLVEDLAAPGETRWPGYRATMLGHDIRGVFAMPVSVAGHYMGALDLFRRRPGPLLAPQLAGAAAAAELAGIPILALLDRTPPSDGSLASGQGWADMEVLGRVEVSQATGMLVAQLDVDPVEALVRLRAHAYATSRPAIEVARDILARRLRLDEA